MPLASVRRVDLPVACEEAARGAEVCEQRRSAEFAQQGDADAVVAAPVRRASFFQRVWRPALDAAKLPRQTRFHDLRHYFASLLIRHGESVKTVQARLGHASATETLDTYSHLWPDSDDRTPEAVDSVLGAPEQPPGLAADR